MTTCYASGIKDKLDYGKWMSRSFNFVTTETDTYVQIELSQGSEYDSGVIYIDDITVKELR